MSETSGVAVVSPFSRFAELDSLRPDVPLTCRVAASPDEVSLHHAIRHAVFVQEQGLFEQSDRDEHDEGSGTVRVLGLGGRIAGGAVRAYPMPEPGLWKGDRLAVLPAFRRFALGASLVRFAVRTAGARGGELMIAYIQPRNVGFFRKLGWHVEGEPAIYVGRLHQQMSIVLGADETRTTPLSPALPFRDDAV